LLFPYDLQAVRPQRLCDIAQPASGECATIAGQEITELKDGQTAFYARHFVNDPVGISRADLVGVGGDE